MWDRIRQRFHSALRYKLLALVLLPLFCAMAATLGYTLTWLHGYTRDALFVSARNDLALARHAMHQLQDEYHLELQQLAESERFRALLKSADRAAIQRALHRLRDARGFAFLHLTGVAGNWLHESPGAERASKPSPLTDRASRGLPGAVLEIFRADELVPEGVVLAERGRGAAADGKPSDERGLVLRLAQPISDEQGRVSMALDAALLLNGNVVLLDAIRDRVFKGRVLPAGAEPIVTLLLGNTRIAATTNELHGLIDEPVAPAVRAKVLERGDTWVGHDEFAGEEYISAYGPLYDVNGARIGTLQVGVRAAAFRAGYYRSAALLLLLFLAATGVAAWIAVRGVRSVFSPIESMAAVARATRAGENRRIGPIATKDEIGELARQFDAMLDQLAMRNREIQRAAAALEVKVGERTHELELKNTELQRTIALLEQTREQLIVAEKMSALGQMAAGIAHEINNPAAVILGNLDVLSAELGPQAQPVAREIELIAQQVERIRHIVTSLLQFARARPGAATIADVSVNQMVQDVQPLVAHALKTKAIVARQRLQATGTIAINVFDVEQVLINLIVNAANACCQGGEIEIATADGEQGGAIISVRDNGHGIPAEQLSRVFDPFFTTNTQHGVGLGLSVSYGLVRRYGGRITVESTLGNGTLFRIFLLRRPKMAATIDHDLTPEPGKELSYG